MRDTRYFKLAYKASLNSDGRQKHGAVLVKGGRIISVGWNRMKNDPKNVTRNFSRHAEIHALAQAKNVKGATMFVVRHNGLNSYPCVNCQEAMMKVGVNWVV